ncbi:MAG: hypothetical protein KGH88_05345 [Thaumarchaeota archaeon]|nr:hypothetical protein [Nitrososphaerota archaeon]
MGQEKTSYLMCQLERALRKKVAHAAENSREHAEDSISARSSWKTVVECRIRRVIFT